MQYSRLAERNAIREAERNRKRHCANYREWARRGAKAFEAGRRELSAHLFQMAAYENKLGGGECDCRKVQVDLTRTA